MKFFRYRLWIFIAILILGCSNSNTNATQPSITSEPITQQDEQEVQEPTPIVNNDKPFRIACVGDSLTEGYGYNNVKNESYPVQLSGLVGKNMEVENFGFTNKTAMHSEKSFPKKTLDPYIKTQKYKDSLAYNPDKVIIMFGTNDIKDKNWDKKVNFIKDYTALIKTYQALSSKPEIYICLPTPSFTNLLGITDTRIKNELIPKIKQIAKDNSLEIIDLHTPFTNKPNLFHDKLHPNKLGAIKMAHIVYETIY